MSRGSRNKRLKQAAEDQAEPEHTKITAQATLQSLSQTLCFLTTAVPAGERSAPSKGATTLLSKHENRLLKIQINLHKSDKI